MIKKHNPISRKLDKDEEFFYADTSSGMVMTGKWRGDKYQKRMAMYGNVFSSRADADRFMRDLDIYSEEDYNSRPEREDNSSEE